jgi:tight adherence protein B
MNGADMLAAAGPGGWLLAVGVLGWVAARTIPSTPSARLRALTGRAPARRAGADRWARAVADVRARYDLLAGRTADRRRRAAVELCRVLATELRAGRDPASAVEAAVSGLPPPAARELAGLVATARAGGDLAAPLAGAARLPGAAGLGYLAACWRVASGTGAGLADVVDRLADGLDREGAARRELAAQLSGPRTTALVLSALPVLGLAMSAGVGGAPLAFLFGSPVGSACLAAGVLLDALGLWWTHRLVRGVLTAHGTE